MNLAPSEVSARFEMAELLTSLNHSELYQLAYKAGYSPHPDLSREGLVELLIEGPKELQPSHPIDELRSALITFIEMYWKTLQPQLKCPAKNLKNPDPSKVDPKPCFGCSDMQVVTCFSLQNTPNQERIIQLRRRS